MLLDPAGIVLCFLIAMTVVMGMANGKIKRPQLYFFPALIGFYLIGAFINLNSKFWDEVFANEVVSSSSYRSDVVVTRIETKDGVPTNIEAALPFVGSRNFPANRVCVTLPELKVGGYAELRYSKVTYNVNTFLNRDQKWNALLIDKPQGCDKKI